MVYIPQYYNLQCGTKRCCEKACSDFTTCVDLVGLSGESRDSYYARCKHSVVGLIFLTWLPMAVSKITNRARIARYCAASCSNSELWACLCRVAESRL